MGDYMLSPIHITAIQDLFSLSVSQYAQVRQYAQGILHGCMDSFRPTQGLILPRLTEILSKSETTHEEFKGTVKVFNDFH